MSDASSAPPGGASHAAPLGGEQSAHAEALEDEAAIIEGLRAGDSRAFERLVRAHVGPLRAAALRLLKDEADADDVVQEAFLSAFRSLDSFRGEARLGTWLHRIAINAALQRLRRRRREDESGQREDIEALLPRFLEDGHAEQLYRPWVQSADELVSRAETRKRVRELIDELPEGYRTVLILRDIEELDTAESADLLGISRGTLKVRLHRARQALRNLLERELELTGEP